MKPCPRLFLVVALLVLCGALFSPSTVAQQPPVVGLVINEDGNSIAVIDPGAGQVIGSTDISAALSKPHLAAYDPSTQRLFVGSKGSKLAVFDLSDSAAPKLIESVGGELGATFARVLL